MNEFYHSSLIVAYECLVHPILEEYVLLKSCSVKNLI